MPTGLPHPQLVALVAAILMTRSEFNLTEKKAVEAAKSLINAAEHGSTA